MSYSALYYIVCDTILWYLLDCLGLIIQPSKLPPTLSYLYTSSAMKNPSRLIIELSASCILIIKCSYGGLFWSRAASSVLVREELQSANLVLFHSRANLDNQIPEPSLVDLPFLITFLRITCNYP